MKSLLVFFLSLGFSSLVLAQSSVLKPIENPKILCASPSSEVVFSVIFNTAQKRIWFGEPGGNSLPEQGVELTVNDWIPTDCPKEICFQAEADIVKAFSPKNIIKTTYTFKFESEGSEGTLLQKARLGSTPLMDEELVCVVIED